jgi:DNA-binding transcriptional LysR family regulator
MTQRIQPSDLGFFVALAQAGSLSAAAREQGISAAAVSRHLGQMEARLGIALVNRTTRRMSLTPEGEVYLEHARKVQREIDDLENRLWGATLAPQGLLRVNATLGFGRSHIAPLISAFCRQYPKVEVQLQLSVSPAFVSALPRSPARLHASLPITAGWWWPHPPTCNSTASHRAHRS